MASERVFSQQLTRRTHALAADRWLLNRIADGVAPAPLRFVLWDGAWAGERGTPLANVIIHDRATLLGLAANGALHFGEAYMQGRLEVQGADLGDALTAMYEGLRRHPPAPASRWRRWLDAAPSLRQSRANVHHHYDLGNDFYRRWLDDAMLYTCAYYDPPTLSLEAAQQAKMALVCRKLRLRPGEHVIEAGCGWGALARYMARHHGVTVTACNVSAEQLAWAREAAAREGLADRVTFVDADYRTLEGRCDAFVSVGMLEHVGLGHYDALGAMMQRVLAPGTGRALLHFIGRSRALPLNPWIRRRIFPGAYPPTLAEVFAGVLEPHGLVVTDVENLRPHYARTLADWRARFDAAAADIAKTFDEAFVRAWRLYLAGSEASFRTGSVELFQVTCSRTEAALPWTRRDLYAVDAAVGA